MRWALVLLLGLLAGCFHATPASRTPTTAAAAPQDLALDYAFPPQQTLGATGPVIEWNFTGYWTHDKDAGVLSLWLDVKLYGREPAGDAFDNLSFPARTSVPFTMHTRFLGIGDYYYKLDALDPSSGALVGRKLGVWETCAAASVYTSRQQC